MKVASTDKYMLSLFVETLKLRLNKTSLCDIMFPVYFALRKILSKYFYITKIVIFSLNRHTVEM